MGFLDGFLFFFRIASYFDEWSHAFSFPCYSTCAKTSSSFFSFVTVLVINMRFFSRKKQPAKERTPFILQENGLFGSTGSISSWQREIDEFILKGSRQAEGEGKTFLGATIPKRRWYFAFTIVFLSVFLFFGRAIQLQIIEGEEYTVLADGNRVRTYTLVPTRGIVLDSQGEILIENSPTFTMSMVIQDLPLLGEERDALLEYVANLLGIHRTEIDLLLTVHAQNRLDPIPIKRNIPYETAMRLAIETASLPGFTLHFSSTRSYPSAIPSLSHVLGYLGKISQEELEQWQESGYRPVDDIGKTGVEQSAETLLRGVTGEYVVEVDARGNELLVLSQTDPIPGQTIVLNIDSALQAFIETQLQKTLEKAGATRASIIVMDPKTGGVRALVSWPSYDSNLFARGITEDQYAVLIEDQDQPLFPRAIAGEFASGSTFKPFIAYTALAEKIVNEHTSFVSTGGLSINEWFFPDWKAGGHGVTDVRKAIAESVNTYFYIIGGGYDTFTGLGVEKITDYAARFGFGFPTGIDLSGEADGFLPSKAWKEEEKGERWYVGDTYHLAIGQGDLLVTPLQMASAVCTIANGGNRVIPHLVESAVFGGGGEETFFFSSEPIEDLDMTALRVVKEGMRQAVTSGSARLLSSLVYPVAGKTGTAQTPGDRPTHAWFIGFGPYSDAEIAVVVMIEEGGEGSLVATPIARDIFS